MLARAATHIHSEWSHDGAWSVIKIAHLFRCLNYHAIFMAEHDVSLDEISWTLYCKECRQASRDKFLVIPGIEYSDPSNSIHVLVWGIEQFLGKRMPIQHTLAKTKDLGGIAVWAHPIQKNTQESFRPEWFKLLFGIEEWNRKADGIAPSEEATQLRKEYDLVPFYGLDFHRLNQLFPLGMNILIDNCLTVTNVISAVSKRQCYPELIGVPPALTTRILENNLLVNLEAGRRLIRSCIKRKKY
jgi:predicted metal-dependent phosphoesterase TrpH